MTVSEARGRLIVYARSQGRCECCTRPASEWHHRVNRSQGGTWSPSNGLHLCRWCHAWVTEHPALAVLLGIGSLPRGTDPATIPAYLSPTMWHRAWWLADADGCWTWLVEGLPPDHPDTPARLAAIIALCEQRRISPGTR